MPQRQSMSWHVREGMFGRGSRRHYSVVRRPRETFLARSDVFDAIVRAWCTGIVWYDAAVDTAIFMC